MIMIPGFTAELSLGKTSYSHRADAGNMIVLSAAVTPAACRSLSQAHRCQMACDYITDHCIGVAGGTGMCHIMHGVVRACTNQGCLCSP
jgi:hypothetical protein